MEVNGHAPTALLQGEEPKVPPLDWRLGGLICSLNAVANRKMSLSLPGIEPSRPARSQVSYSLHFHDI
jgi:hypothetical protein